ncbi:MAG: 2-oxoacid:acceptor oxidoreductase family protein, partial [bacterium]|nr:2-oxoacid:acceptor oxidoreductase family protein [bacterium]
MKKISNRFTWKICGEAGFGVNSSGLLFSKLCARSGLFAYEYSEYPSLIRGGHQTSQITVDVEPIFSEHYNVDILIALNKQSIVAHLDELSGNSAMIYDSSQFQLSSIQDIVGEKIKKTFLLGVPFTQLAIEASNLNLLRNTVAIGASLGLLQYNPEELFGLITEEFAKKDPKIVEMNKKAVILGFEYVRKNYDEFCSTFMFQMEKMPQVNKTMVISGNEAIGIGAIRG